MAESVKPVSYRMPPTLYDRTVQYARRHSLSINAALTALILAALDEDDRSRCANA